ncbi:hypothetical protein Adt_33050 [Abeliophyllum distichum]|uniref:Uncharacterized protein n=1 Tax=Abeliophyllum distichum TaxID=126358 RepID=A0ABD1QYS2_9LAMI
MNVGEDYPDDTAPVPPPAPATGSDLSIQLAQLMAAHTEMGQAIGTIQGVRDLQRVDAMTRSNLRTFDYQYHQLHDQVSRIGSRMETINENVARISGTVSSFSR